MKIEFFSTVLNFSFPIFSDEDVPERPDQQADRPGVNFYKTPFRTLRTKISAVFTQLHQIQTLNPKMCTKLLLH
jgi:hypothetical protein